MGNLIYDSIHDISETLGGIFMSISVHFNDPSSGISVGIGQDRLFGVEVNMEAGIIHSLKFSSITQKCSYNDSGISAEGSLSNIIVPSRTNVTLTEGETIKFAGRVYSIGNGVEVTGSVQFACEDCRGYLKESFIWYSKDPDWYDDEENPDPNPKYRALMGDDVDSLITAIAINHNRWMGLTYGWANQGAIFNGLTGLPEGATLNNDLALDGLSTYEALEQIFEDQGLEWDIAFPMGLGINLRCAERFTETGGNITTGVNLKSFSRTEKASEIFTAILPLSGYGYNGRRLSLSNYDFNTNEGFSKLSTDPTAITRLVQVYDQSKGEFVDSPNGEREGILAINEALYNRFGLKIKVIIYDDIVCDSDLDEEIAYWRDILVTEALTDATLLNHDIIEWSCDAADLSNVIGGAAAFKLYGMYNISDRIGNLAVANCRMIKVHINYDDPSRSTCSFEIPTILE